MIGPARFIKERNAQLETSLELSPLVFIQISTELNRTTDF